MKFFDNIFLASQRNSSLDGLRGLAVFFIFNVHLFALYYKNNYYLSSYKYLSTLSAINAGHIGVDIFFILSGFFIYLTIKNNNYSLLSFLTKRYSRLLPLTVFVLIYSIQSVTSFGILIDQITLLNLFGKSNKLNYVQWSLVYEVYFYVLIGVMLIVYPDKFDRYGPLILLITLILMLSLFINLPFEASRFVEFFFGVIIVKSSKDNKLNNISILKKGYLPFISIASMLACSFFWGNDFLYDSGNKALNSILFYIPFGLIFSILLASIVQRNSVALTIFSFYPLRLLGVISFSFYMIHALIAIPFGTGLTAHIFDKLFFPKSTFLFVASNYILSFSIAFLISLFLYYFLEKPYFSRVITKQQRLKFQR